MLINATPGKSLGIYSENIDHSSYYGSRYSWDSQISSEACLWAEEITFTQLVKKQLQHTM